jgi:hypothetical protein
MLRWMRSERFRGTTRNPIYLAAVIAPLLVLAVAACHSPDAVQTTSATSVSAPAAAAAPSPRAADVQARDLSIDESMGGHTLARHVGKTDAELADRLRRERQISSASTYTDRATAERVVSAALASAGNRLTTWQHRSGRRPNLVLRYVERTRPPIGRSLPRGGRTSISCDRALVVLRWSEPADRFYVLTSYPEAER